MLVSTTTDQLPEPSAQAHAVSKALEDIIRRRIKASGPIGFDQFMQLALYEPENGYYMAGLPKFGSQGDFVTAPEVSALFSYALAEQCAEVLQQLPAANVLEIGAGRGLMAADLLHWLDRRDSLPEHYYILELSADLRKRQRESLQNKVPQLADRVVWLESLQDFSLHGIILANEVLDAIPLKRFRINDTAVDEICIRCSDQSAAFEWHCLPAADNLKSAVRLIEDSLAEKWPSGFSSEVNLNIKPWLRSIAGCLQQGVLLAIDYGYPQSEYYRPSRRDGTIMCHYRHYVHEDPLLWPGLQDITAHVDFTALANAAAAAGMQPAGFTRQAEFLFSCGLEAIVAELSAAATESERFDRAQQLKTLLLPSAMGERFQVMALAKQYPFPLLGFKNARDDRHRL